MIADEEMFLVRGCGVNEREVQEAVDRAVRNEARILTIETTVKAVAEISSEVRKDVRSAVDELRRHSLDDNTRFSSIDSRFVGEQNQLTSIITTLSNIEKKVNEEHEDVERLVAEVFDTEGNSRLRPLLSAEQQRKEFWHALKAQWAFVASGAGFASALIGGVVALTKLL
jgi:hypothetical protein